MARLRDNQQSRVYRCEAKASKTLRRLDGASWTVHRHTESEFDTLQECADFLNPIWRRERGRYALAGQVAHPIERPSWGQRSALAHRDHRITLPRWARNRWVILHEAAHRLCPANEDHGPRFVGVLIGLLARYAGYDVQELMGEAFELDASWRQVRGASLHLVRSGVARLKRDLLVLLPGAPLAAAAQ
ncbi:hypothetical protein [Hydrogenophaga sp. PML113]|uniref:hypothetical protein n=1 Tax=Hydrogenophaga sp. PML113 TaxID=1899350 RepID=UPI000878AA1A|nr:hypothetical protein [Hydrogenophaga sp. PML113]